MSWYRLYHEEDGQALFYGAGVIVLLVALFFGAMDLGLLVLGKIQAQNAADSAAMSAASLKVSVHNTRVLAYRAASGQLTMSRMQLIKATSLAFQEVAEPGKGNAKQFKDSLKLARGHRLKVEKLRNGILQFNQWVTDDKLGPQLARQAAEVGYLGNIGTLGSQVRNLSLMDGVESLAENDRAFGNQIVGRVTFPGEALTSGGSAGKSRALITPKMGALGGAWLKYGADDTLEADAVAGPVDAAKLYGKTAAMTAYGIPWYTVRLQPIGVDPKRKQP